MSAAAPRIQVPVDEQLLEDVRAAAAETDRSVAAYARHALRAALAKNKKDPAALQRSGS